MTKIDEIFTCIDCHQLLETGDLTYFDGTYEPEMADIRAEQCQSGMVRLMEIFSESVRLYGTGKELELSRFPCQCCYNKDAGERFRFIVYQEKT